MELKISLCIPQYNRIEYLLINLNTIAQQSYQNIEIIISDDCSSDDTEEHIHNLIPTYKYPIIYKKNVPNKGYDFNLRQSLDLATGDYCFILGNDDTLWQNDSMENLVLFLTNNNLPDVGFCNFIEDSDHNKLIERASKTAIIGTGFDCALRYYRSFSFVAGVIYKKEAFNKVNTAKHDGSVFVQMFFAAKIIASGGVFFTIKEPMVLKDLRINKKMANSYKDTLPKKWKDFKSRDAGLPQVIRVGVDALVDLNYNRSTVAYIILKGVYRYSYTYWLLDFRSNKSFIGALGFVSGLFPTKIINFKDLSFIRQIQIFAIYSFSTTIGLLTPIALFKKMKLFIYKRIKK